MKNVKYFDLNELMKKVENKVFTFTIKPRGYGREYCETINGKVEDYGNDSKQLVLES